MIEPVDDETLSFAMTLEPGTRQDFTLQAQAVIAIGGVRATLPLTVRVVSGGEFQVNSTRRIRSGM